jgi:hypothetical protein
MLNGKGIKQGYEITGAVSLLDTPATMAHLLGVDIPAVWEGKPVLEAFV